MRILLIVHGYPPASCGGTETYVAALAGALSRQPGVEVSVLAREGDPLRPELAVRHERRGSIDLHLVNNTFQVCESFEESYTNPRLAAAADAIVDRVRPDVVHVQHLTCLSTQIVAHCRRREIPVVMTLNDYWYICHRGQLIDRDGHRCDGPGDGGCARCIPAAALAPAAAWRAARGLRLRAAPGVRTALSLAQGAAQVLLGEGRSRAASLQRSRQMRDLCRQADLVLAPSRTLEDAYRRFGVDRLEWIDQGIDLPPADERTARGHEPALRVAFAGSLMLSKGPHVLLDALDRLPPGAVTVDLFGSVAPYHGDERYAHALSARLGDARIRHLGPVPHHAMPALLARVDLLVVPSVWIENAPFVIREAFAAGVPVVASRLGGMADMVRDGVDGLLFEPGDAASLAAQLRRALEEPDLLPRLRAGIGPVFSIDDDARQLVERYRGLRAGAGASGAPTADPRSSGPPALAAVVLNYRTPDQTWLAVRSLQTSSIAPRVIVVDNGSADGSEPHLRDRLPGVEVLQTGSNGGFSAGCNTGIRSALAWGADAVLLVNSDVVLPPETIGQLTDALAGDPRIGLAAPVILSRAEPDVIASAGMIFSARTGRMRHRAAGQRLAALGDAGVHRVDAVSGCAVLVRRQVFERIGLLDDACFFSFEDVDFCLRARTNGFDTVCVAGAVAYHEGGRTMGKRSPRRVYYGVRNHLRVAGRSAPLGPAAAALRGAMIVMLNVAYVLRSPDVPLAGGLASVGRGAVDHLRGRYGA
ncbi:MAG TPA: glycosyltransferase [Dehalococcoidia bacterium]|nr:glycosyltransferase [Dehalococcoidia bacterium]